MQLKQLVSDFLAWLKVRVKQGTNAPRTLDYYSDHLRMAQRFVGGKTEVADIQPFTLAMWATTWHRWQVLQRLFNWAQDLEIISTSPAARLEKPQRGERKRILTRPEEVHFLRAAKADFREFVIGMRESMARPQEVRELRWEWLKQSANGHWFFALDEFKARRRRKDKEAIRIIPVTARLSRLLSRIAARRGRTGVVFLTRKGASWSKETIRGRIRTIRRRLKLEKDRRGENVVAYTWRHTSATAMCTRGFRDKMLAELMGHTNTKTTARYQHPPPDELLNTFNEIHSNATKAAKVSEDLVDQLEAIVKRLKEGGHKRQPEHTW